MKFCPSCKGFMMPKREENKTILVCRRCGLVIDEFKSKDYKIKDSPRKKAKDILVIEKTKRESMEERRKYIVDLYGTEAYEE